MPTKRRDRKRSGGYRSTLKLNQGSGSTGRGGVFPMNKPGGTFGAGRPAGGGVGAQANPVAGALAVGLGGGAHPIGGGPGPMDIPGIGPPTPPGPPDFGREHPSFPTPPREPFRETPSVPLPSQEPFRETPSFPRFLMPPPPPPPRPPRVQFF